MNVKNFLIMLFIVGFSCMAQSNAKSEQDLFIIEDLLIDVEDVDATAARNKAFNQAQIEGFFLLVDRLLKSDQAEKMALTNEQDIFRVVKDIAVSDERHSANRYKALFDIRFAPDKTQALFERNRASFSALESRPILILPLLKQGDEYVLWEEDNPWKEAWENYEQPRASIMPIKMPLGDLQDVKEISADLLMANQPIEIEGLKSRHAVKDIFVLVAEPQSAPFMPDEETEDAKPVHELKIRVLQFFGSLPVEIDSINVSGTFAEVIDITHDHLKERWKSEVEVVAGVTGKLKARVFFGSLREWLNTKSKLEEMVASQKITLKRMTQAYADIELGYAGDIQTLFRAMEQANLFLSRTAILENDYHIIKQK